MQRLSFGFLEKLKPHILPSRPDTSGSAPEDDDAIHSRGVAGGVHGPLGRRGAGRAAERPKLLREGIKVQVVQVTSGGAIPHDLESLRTNMVDV